MIGCWIGQQQPVYQQRQEAGTDEEIDHEGTSAYLPFGRAATRPEKEKTRINSF